ncbi:3D domain-containing protein [Effusibacillus dendaii]|uniref:LysM domain-containing protein n=1 Tax=Effusibacillus dendaii TaxID=2743772 RepID=A0A7I8D9R4_9BACL|nr:3D domain-containing protein [Effusibacillus dendaii]BCJ86854.1 hypothetical protein skT53_18390 [Effusibacillus dendaii]
MKTKKTYLLALLVLMASLFLPSSITLTQAKDVCDCHKQSLQSALASRSGFSTWQNKEPFVSHQIKAGDTLSGLAQLYGTDIATLIAMNSVTDPRALQIGQTLTIPKSLKQQQIPAVMSTDKIMNFNLTAYTAGPESTGKYPGHPGYGITSTGTRATEGRTIAVDPHVIPYGTKVYIEGVGIRTAEDTGGAINGNRIDVYMEDLGQALRFGVKKNVRVYVLSSPNG